MAKDGVYYDRCPEDGCLEVDAIHKAGGMDPHGEEHRDWSIFNADRRDGGCGATWSKTTKTGAERMHSQGKTVNGLTRDAEVDRTYTLAPMSETYQENYRRIFGHD